MIVRDEAASLAGCIASARDLATEIVVADTGSTDSTADIARGLGAKVTRLEWRDDFSAARNTAIEGASGDWILVLDADERLAPDAPAYLRSFLEGERAESTSACALTVVSFLSNASITDCEVSNNVRLFRNCPGHRYRGRIHEQILPAIQETSPSLAVVHLPAQVLHYGYLSDRSVAERKALRNLRLIRASLADSPDDPHMRYHAGVCLFNLGDLQGAIDNLRLAVLRGDPTLNYPARAVKIWAMALLRLGLPGEALALLDQWQKHWPPYTDLEYLRAQAHRAAGDYSRALDSLARCIEMGPSPPPYDSHPGVSTYKAAMLTGEIALLLGDNRLARSAFERLMPGNPGYLGAQAKLLELYAQRLGRAEALKELARSLPAKGRSAMLGEICGLAGWHQEALDCFGRSPWLDGDRGHLLVGRSLFATGRAADAAEALHRINEGSVCRSEAQRWLCCCALATRNRALMPESALPDGLSSGEANPAGFARMCAVVMAEPPSAFEYDRADLVELVEMMAPYPDNGLLRQAISACGSDQGTAIRLAEILFADYRRPDLALEAYPRFKEGDRTAPYLLARILAALGRIEEALAACSAWLTSGRADPAGYLMASQLYMRLTEDLRHTGGIARCESASA